MSTGALHITTIATGLARALFVLLPLAGLGRAYAQDTSCGLPDGLTGDFQATPADGATKVARDAPMRVRYGSRAALDQLLESLRDEPDVEACSGLAVCLLHAGDLDHAVPGVLERVDDTQLMLVPNDPLAPSARHWLLVARPGLDLVARAELELTTGTGLDQAAPDMAFDQAEIALDVKALPPDCDAAPGSVRILVETPALTDDADPDSVELLVFLSRARGLTAPTLLTRVRNDTDPVRAHLVLSPAQASGPVCLALRAIDGVSKLSEQEHELCFDPNRDVAFAAGCAVVARAGGRGSGAAFVVLGCALGCVWLARRAHRRERAKAARKSRVWALGALLP